MRKIEHCGVTLWRLTDATPPPADWGYAFAAHAAEADDPARRRWAPDGRFHTHFTAHIVIEGGSVTLVDAGIGPGPVAYFNGLEGRLDRELAGIGVTARDVTAVMLTHLHLDHVGWASRGGEPCFPNARYVMPAAELDHWRRNGAQAALPHHVAAFETHVAPLLAKGLLTGIDDGVFAPESGSLRFLSLAGHTPGHAAVMTGDQELIIAGDSWHSPAQVERPEWCHRADREPADAVRSRIRLAALAADRKSLIAAGHFPEASGFGHVMRDGAGFLWRPVSPDEEEPCVTGELPA